MLNEDKNYFKKDFKKIDQELEAYQQIKNEMRVILLQKMQSNNEKEKEQLQGQIESKMTNLQDKQKIFEKRFDSLLDKTIDQHKKKEYEIALDTFNKAEEIVTTVKTLNVLFNNNHFYVLYSLKANIYYDMERYVDAKVCYKKSLKVREKELDQKNPEIGKTLENLGLVYNKLDKGVKVQKCYERAYLIYMENYGHQDSCVIKIFLRLVDALFNLADIYERQERYADAIKNYAKVLELCYIKKSASEKPGIDLPEYVQKIQGNACSKMFNCYEKNGDFKNALFFAKKVKQLCEKRDNIDDYLESLYNIGSIYVHQELLLKARKWYNKALEKLCKIKDDAKAKELKAAIYQGIATSYQKQKDNIQAISIYEKALEINGFNESIQNNIAIIYQRQGELSKAISVFKVSAENKVTGINYTIVSYTLATVYFDLGCYVQAIHSFEKALRYREEKLGNEHFRTNNARLGLARSKVCLANSIKSVTPKKSKDLFSEAIKLLRENIRLNYKIIKKGGNFNDYSLIMHNYQLQHLADIFCYKAEYNNTVNLYLDEINRYEVHFPIVTLKFIQEALKYADNLLDVDERKTTKANLYYMRATIYAQSTKFKQYALAINNLEKAISLYLRAPPEWQAKLVSLKQEYQIWLSQFDSDIVMQLEHVIDTYYELQIRYLDDVADHQNLSEYSKNRTTELVIMLRHILDQLWNRLIRTVIFEPNEKAPGNLYFPVGGSKEAIDNKLRDQQIIKPLANKISPNDLVLERPGFEALITELKAKGYLADNHLLTEKAFNSLSFSSMLFSSHF